MAVQITVLNRNDQVILNFNESISIETKVSEFKTIYNKECRKLGLKVLDESRLYFTVGSSKGVSLKDKNKMIGDYLSD